MVNINVGERGMAEQRRHRVAPRVVDVLTTKTVRVPSRSVGTVVRGDKQVLYREVVIVVIVENLPCIRKADLESVGHASNLKTFTSCNHWNEWFQPGFKVQVPTMIAGNLDWLIEVAHHFQLVMVWNGDDTNTFRWTVVVVFRIGRHGVVEC